jgi:hypothetical protein
MENREQGTGNGERGNGVGLRSSVQRSAPNRQSEFNDAQAQGRASPLQGESGPGRKLNWMAGRLRAVARALSDLGFASPEAALEDITLLSAATQLAKYEEECARFERKG